MQYRSMKSLLLLTTSVLAALADSATDRVIYLFRHGEKMSSTGPLNATGLARAAKLPTIFCTGCAFLAPEALFAYNYTEGYAQRCVEFLTPIALERGLPINNSFGFSPNTTLGQAAAAAGILQTLQAHSSILVAWEHHALPVLAAWLGVDPALVPLESWPSNDFSTVWVLSYNPDGTLADFSVSDEGLPALPGDTGRDGPAIATSRRHGRALAAALVEPK